MKVIKKLLILFFTAVMLCLVFGLDIELYKPIPGGLP